MRQSRHPRVAGVLHFSAACWLVLYLVHTPIHLLLEPHADVAAAPTPSNWTAVPPSLSQPGGDAHEDHDRHPALEHQLKLLKAERVIAAARLLVPAAQMAEVRASPPQSSVFGFSGLSPPELSCSWQFLLRAALPVRAPSGAS